MNSNVRTMRLVPTDADLADALAEAVELLEEHLPADHALLNRLQDTLAQANVMIASAHVRSNAVRQWMGGYR